MEYRRIGGILQEALWNTAVPAVFRIAWLSFLIKLCCEICDLVGNTAGTAVFYKTSCGIPPFRRYSTRRSAEYRRSGGIPVLLAGLSKMSQSQIEAGYQRDWERTDQQ